MNDKQIANQVIGLVCDWENRRYAAFPSRAALIAAAWGAVQAAQACAASDAVQVILARFWAKKLPALLALDDWA